MGNCLRFLSGLSKPDPSSRPDASQPQYLGPHGVTSVNVGVSALARDILNFDSTSQVPDGLSRYVVSSKKAQANWYRKLFDAWKNAKPPPRSPEEAARLVILTLKRHQKADVQGLLRFYGLPYLTVIDLTDSDEIQSSLPQGAQYKFETLPVDARAVVDGDGMTVYVNTASPRESSIIPREVVEGTVERARARAARDFKTADAIHKAIVDAGYRVLLLPGTNNEEILAHKYRIRLRGIDAPENSMPYGKEAKEELLKLVQGKCLTIFVYEEDRYGRKVGDIHCDGVFVQEVMLKKGCAWHYTAYDKRPEFAEWEKSARAARRGLWAAKNPEKPWDYRRDIRNGA